MYSENPLTEQRHNNPGGPRPDVSGLRVAIAVFGPAVLTIALAVGGSRLVTHSQQSGEGAATVELDPSTIPTNELGSLAINATSIDNGKPQLQWQQFP
jgi:hypothetical protein